MAENLLNRKDNNYKSAEKYVLRYFDDLQNHFSLSDMQIVNILKKFTRNLNIYITLLIFIIPFLKIKV